MTYLLQQLLRTSAAQYPDKTAVWARGRSITYRELSEQSNRLAHLLLQNGVAKGDRVGLYFPKCIEAVVCMFAVLKAGGVYVPLDPHAPADRIGYIIVNCGIRVLLTNSEQRKKLGAHTLEQLALCVATDQKVDIDCNGVIPWIMLDKYPPTEPSTASLIETDLAYILYTSGSTGRPKGVMITHRNALTFIKWCASTFAIRNDDRLSNHAPLHFDLSVFDVYNAIEAGATVYLVTEDISLFAPTLADFIVSQGITVWYSVPSALTLLLLHTNLNSAKVRLRTILFAGEVFPMKYLRELAQLLPNAQLYNLYGPTETNVCTYYPVARDRLSGMETLPIGRACENTEVFAVTDRDQIATAPGESGELFVRGPSLASGYWADADKTAAALVPNRFQPYLAEKIYRTGDLVKLSEDGNYYFLGRRDSMIKSRGYRIELGEIETTLLTHPAVREAVAIALPDEIVGNRIKAVVSLHESQVLQPVDLQLYCSSRIPKYMIPEFIEFRNSLPKTSTGKVDRVRLSQCNNLPPFPLQ